MSVLASNILNQLGSTPNVIEYQSVHLITPGCIFNFIYQLTGLFGDYFINMWYNASIGFRDFIHSQAHRNRQTVTGVLPAVSRWCGRLPGQPCRILDHELSAAGPLDPPRPASSYCSVGERRQGNAKLDLTDGRTETQKLTCGYTVFICGYCSVDTDLW